MENVEIGGNIEFLFFFTLNFVMEGIGNESFIVVEIIEVVMNDDGNLGNIGILIFNF